MDKYLDLIKTVPLFADMDEGNLPTLLNCLDAKVKKFRKNDFVFMADDRVTSVGVVLSGSVNVIREDFWGNRTILTHVGVGEMFGEAFSCADIKKLPVSVEAAEKTDIMLIDYIKIIKTCTNSCDFHTQLVKNMLYIIAAKNIMLTKTIEHITQRTTKEKILSYLSDQSKRAGSTSFTIPFDRQGLADYLAVDRSALSNELSKLKSQGMIKYNKNIFELTQ